MPYLGHKGSSVDDSSTDWFAFRVRARHEKSVALHLREKKQECFVPLVWVTRRWGKRLADVELPLFAGYVFCRSQRFRLLPILTTPGIIEVLRAGNSPVPVSTVEISAIKRALDANIPVEPSLYINVGETVQIQRGPLKGIVGIVSDLRRRDRIVLSVSLIRCSILLHVDLLDLCDPPLSAVALDSNIEDCGVNCQTIIDSSKADSSMVF
jgi:transcription antitermination factor NusG